MNRTLVLVLILIVALSIPLSTSAGDKALRANTKPDRLGSWGYINDDFAPDESWRQIVKDSEFQLGEYVRDSYWGPDDDRQYYGNIGYGTYPSLDGSTVSVPMAVEFARQHLGLSYETATSLTYFSTTDCAYMNLIDKGINNNGHLYVGDDFEVGFFDEYHPVDLIIATEPSQTELEKAEEAGVELTCKPVCYDAFVFITSINNPVANLSSDQVRDIYSGKITNWRELGGLDEPIVAYQREPGSGSQTTMEQRVMLDEVLASAPMAVINDMGTLIDVVGEYDNGAGSIGYTFKFYIDTLYKSDKIKTLAIDGVAPTRETIRSGEYPFTTSYYAVIRSEDADACGGKFMNWMLTDEGQTCIEQAGYLPLR